MKVFKTKKFQTAWGASGQRQLEIVFQELRSHDFVEPQVGSDAYSFAFHRIVDDDLTQVIYISRTGEYPSGVFNFDCFFLIHSKWLSRANDLINPEDVGKVLRSAVGSSIFVITQSHLRWKESFSTENPCWYVSDLAGYEHSIDAWITDWRRLISPIAQTLVDLPSVIRHCESNQNYEADLWVKSDGYHVTLASNTALLLLKNSESVKAIELLRVALTWPVRQPIQKHFQKVLDWIESSPQV